MIRSVLRRDQYPVLSDSVYLNQASLGLLSDATVQSMHTFLDTVARHGNTSMTDEDEVRYLDGLRQRGARLLGCEETQLAILGGASEILSQVPFLLKLSPGSKIICVSTDFPAVTRPWIRYTDRGTCKLQFVDENPEENLTETIIRQIDAETGLVAVGSVQYSTGSQIDIPRLRDAASACGARLVIDVTQSAGIQPIDFRNWGVDAVVTSGYKWLGGHGGVALAALSPRLMEDPPMLAGWMGTTSPFDFEAMKLGFADDARRFTQSTMSYLSIGGLSVALDQLLAVRAEQIEEHSRQLKSALLEDVSHHGWSPYRDVTDASSSPHIVALSHPEIGAATAYQALKDARIVCGVRNGRIRVSLAPYNDSTDVLALAGTLGRLNNLN